MTTDTFTRVTGRAVIASGTAESIGSVKGFVVAVDGRRIEAIHVDGRGKRARILHWTEVQAFGADAVMASPGVDPSPLDDDHQKAAVKGDVSMLGARVLSVGGRELGTVVDVQFDMGTGAIVSVGTAQGPIDANRVRSLGSYALVVEDAGPLQDR